MATRPSLLYPPAPRAVAVAVAAFIVQFYVNVKKSYAAFRSALDEQNTGSLAFLPERPRADPHSDAACHTSELPRKA
jgi:hypothetical protein